MCNAHIIFRGDKMKVLEGKNITKSYDGTAIIEDVSLYVNEGEIVALLGVSGVGKSTLFNIMSGLETPDEGDVYLEGKCITGSAGHIGYMQQNDLLLPFKTIIKNVMIPLSLSGVNKKEAYERAFSQLSEFGLSQYKDMYPDELSGGMRQRVSLARTFLYGKRVMLMDEPFSALDAITRRDMQTWFKEKAKEKNIASLLITHDIDEALLLADRIYVLAGSVGRIVLEVEKNQNTDAEKLKKIILEKVR